MAKNETGISDTGEKPNPLNQKVRRTSDGWQRDEQAAIGDGRFRMSGTRNSAALRTSRRFSGKGR